jgi:hypothetical protein
MSKLLVCDGCGQLADSVHIARRLERLAWSTRFRSVHIQALLMAGIAPKENAEFLYAPDSGFHGEAGEILNAVEVRAEGKAVEAVLGEFQKLGLMLAHVLECPLNDGVSVAESPALLEKQLPSVFARIRRSLKPKRVLLLSSELAPQAQKFHDANLECPVLPSSGTFLTSLQPTEADLHAFRSALSLATTRSA